MLGCFYRSEKYHIINVYTAPEDRKKSQLFNRLGELLTVDFNLILCGDFNTVTSENDDSCPFCFWLYFYAEVFKGVSVDLLEIHHENKTAIYKHNHFQSSLMTQ